MMEALFPDCLYHETVDRLHVQQVPDDYLKDIYWYAGRISDIKFKDNLSFRFYMDGRKSGKYCLSERERAWLETGLLEPVQIAAHYAAAQWPDGRRIAEQKGLFD